MNTEKYPQNTGNLFLKTMNNMGFMVPCHDPYSQAFIALCSQVIGPVLEIGAAYEGSVLKALEAGAMVIANDQDPRHLEILRQKVPDSHQKRLILKPGRFPEDLIFEPSSLSAILISRVLHFFDGPALIHGVKILYQWLTVGGKVFATAETPYLKNLSSFIPVYESRLAEGMPWPGFIENFALVDPMRAKALPPQMHLLDPFILEKVFLSAGFRVEQVGFFSRPEFPEDLRLDGRESVGIIAVK